MGGGGLFWEKVDFSVLFGEKCTFGILFGRKRTFLHDHSCTFWEKVDSFARFLGESELLSLLFRRKWTILHAFRGDSGLFWQNMSKIVDHFGHFRAMGGGAPHLTTGLRNHLGKFGKSYMHLMSLTVTGGHLNLISLGKIR